jgi:hypothetical protein
MELIGESIAIHGALNDVWELSTDYLSLGLLARQVGDSGDAETFFWKSLELAQQVREIDKIAFLLDALAGLCVKNGEYDRAAPLMVTAETLWETVETESFRKTVEVAFPENERELRKEWEIAIKAHAVEVWEQTRRTLQGMSVHDVVSYGVSATSTR